MISKTKLHKCFLFNFPKSQKYNNALPGKFDYLGFVKFTFAYICEYFKQADFFSVNCVLKHFKNSSETLKMQITYVSNLFRFFAISLSILYKLQNVFSTMIISSNNYHRKKKFCQQVKSSIINTYVLYLYLSIMYLLDVYCIYQRLLAI